MPIRIGDEAPDFTAESTHGPIQFHEWMNGQWTILFSHPKNFTPVCTTELGYMARIAPEFARRNCRIAGLSTDSVADHARWMQDIHETQGAAVEYPIISDTELTVAKLYEMLPADAKPGTRTAADNATVRTVLVIGPDRKVKATIAYPMSTGRNFDEVLRLLDSLQLTAAEGLATPVNWQPGGEVIIPLAISNEDADKRFPQGYTVHKPYLRTVEL